MDGGERTIRDDAGLEGEEFLGRLSDEEKECLQYLLETIDSLEEEEGEESSSSQRDGGEHLRNSASSLPDGSVKDGRTPSKMKIVKSYSEDGPGLSITVTPDKGQRSFSSHPSHLRKFDTIMRCGVNVQELRARFAQQSANSSLDSSKESSPPSKQAAQAARNPASPRQEALQKLGLLKLNQSPSNMGGMLPRDPHDTEERRPGNSVHGNQNLTRSVERKPGDFGKIWPP